MSIKAGCCFFFYKKRVVSAALIHDNGLSPAKAGLQSVIAVVIKLRMPRVAQQLLAGRGIVRRSQQQPQAYAVVQEKGRQPIYIRAIAS